MGIIKLIIAFLFLLFFPLVVNASWIGPIYVIEGKWGIGKGEFGIYHGDSGVDFPFLSVVTPNNKIVISDMINKKQLVYELTGKLIKEVMWKIKNTQGSSTIYEIPEYSFGVIEGFGQNGDIYVSDGLKYYFVTTTGQLLKTYETRPLEMGIVKEDLTQNDKTKLTIEYPEKKYSTEILEYGPEDKITQDILENLYVIQRRVNVINNDTDKKDYIQHYIVNRIDNCIADQVKLDMPENKHEVVGYDVSVGKRKKALELYGEPVISPNGDVYTWRYTPEKYSILKWTWQGPEDAPQSVQISSGVAGLKLNWQKPVKEVETVTGYQILRSTEVCGPFNEVVMVKKDKLTFEDMTIKPPWKYYYVVKAVRDKKSSGESNKVYMQWK